MNDILSPTVRSWLYGIALAVLPILVGYGILTEAEAPLWAALIGSVLVPGVAFANRPTKRPQRRQ